MKRLNEWKERLISLPKGIKDRFLFLLKHPKEVSGWLAKNWKKGVILLPVLICVALGGAELLLPTANEDAVQDEAAKVPLTEQTTAEEKAVPYDYDLTPYLTLGDVSPVKAKFDDPEVCTEKEIDEAIFHILLEKASFDDAGSGAKAALYNKVTVDVTVVHNGKELSDHQKTDHDVIIGLYTDAGEDIVVGGALVGAAVGDKRKVEYTYPAELDGEELSGQTVELVATVKKIYRQTLPILDDSTVSDITGGKFATVKAFRESVKEELKAEKKTAKAQAVWLAIKNGATVLKYPEKELEAAVSLYRQNYEAIAAKFELTLEQLVTVYMESDMDTFLADAETYAREKVTNDMIMTQLVRQLNVTLTDEEFELGAKAYYELEEEGRFSSFEEFLKFYTEENLRRNLLWDKALKTAEDGAVRVQ